MSYNSAAIRELLQIVLSDEALTIFCFDHFRPVHQQFAADMSRLRKVQLLIEHCDKYEEFDKLLALVKAINPHQYEKFSDLIKAPPKIPQGGMSAGPGQPDIHRKSQSAEKPAEPHAPRQINIGTAQGLTIGDHNTVIQTFAGKAPAPVHPTPAASTQRCADLAENMRETLKLIKEYEEQRRLSGDPREKRRADRDIADLREQLSAHEAEARELGCE